MEDNTILNPLIEDFKARSQKSLNKATLLERELEEYENLFDYQKWNISTINLGATYQYAPVPPSINRNDISRIRLAYDYFVIRGNDIATAGEWYKKVVQPITTQSTEELQKVGLFFYKLALEYYECLQYLRELANKPKKFPDKYFAWYHQILINLNKESRFPNNFGKKEIIEFGKNKYNTGEGFYKTINKLDLTKTTSFVQSMSKKDRAQWKAAIADISNNDADVVNYLTRFPN